MKKFNMLIAGLIIVGAFIFGGMNINEAETVDIAGHGMTPNNLSLYKINDSKYTSIS